ncbi:MAG TPA: hypothetical protein PKX92_09600 [Edaphocola sp.]|nr:hypothetical protein [Edaphocola sp.]
MKIVYFLLSLFLVLFSSSIQAQNYKFFGVLTLANQSKQKISYHLFFTQNNGVVSGYSITDIGGKHETKNIITGRYDPVSKVFSFKEEEIIYTKSKLSQDIFCFVNYSGVLKFKGKEAMLKGDFNGKFKNLSTCATGTINLWGEDAIKNVLTKIDKKIEKKDIYRSNTPKLKETFENLYNQNIVNKENLNVFVENKPTIKILIWDNATQDGDRIDMYLNGKKILNDYEVLNQKKEIILNLERKQNILKIVALNQGSQGLNTVMVSVENNEAVQFQSNLKINESSTVTFVKKDN